ncbi:MAG: hypothetical protein FWH19_04395 [Treponema sp.]|nr:hypothetical protein [Treponema sp.]
MQRRFGLLGESLSHSFSSLIHAELGDYEYRLYEKKPEELAAFLQQGDFDGLNVTIPYKKSVTPFCTSLCESARATGSVNTITRLSDGSLCGDNTDCYGFSYLLKKTGVNPAAGKTLVLGSGGSSLSIQAVLGDMGAREIVVVSRKGPVNYSSIEEHRNAILIVNTTPVGMYPDNGSSPITELNVFTQCRAIIDLVYNPARTELLLQAEDRGIPAFNGLAMLVAQAKKASELFMGASIPDNLIETIGEKIRRLSRNIVLIGMPGCGKTGTGRALAKKMGRTFADTDEWVAKAAAKPVPAIITEDGEERFRELETEALLTLCKESGLVIATGGGVVTRPGNWRIIRQNGIMIFLERDLSQLSVSGRPLSERDGIAALAEERLPLYRQWSDYTVAVRGIEQTASDISLLTNPV